VGSAEAFVHVMQGEGEVLGVFVPDVYYWISHCVADREIFSVCENLIRFLFSKYMSLESSICWLFKDISSFMIEIVVYEKLTKT